MIHSTICRGSMRPKIRGKEDGTAAGGEIVGAHLLARPLVILTRADDEFHFVAFVEVRDVAPQVARALRHCLAS